MCCVPPPMEAARKGPCQGLANKGTHRSDAPLSYGKGSPAFSQPGSLWGSESLMVVYCCNCPMDKTFWVPCRLKFCFWLLSDQFPLPNYMYMGVMRSFVARTPDAQGENVVLWNSFTYPFFSTCSGLGASPGALQLHVSFPVSSLFNLGVCVACQLSVFSLKRSV